MKPKPEIKYPHSANLFKFCRRVLSHQHQGVRVIDQEIGQILGFDPSDCSNWKQGRKGIYSIKAIKTIAKHLEVEEELLHDIVLGNLDDGDAYLEYSGHGAHELNQEIIEQARKAFHRKFANSWSNEREKEFQVLTAIDAYKINAKVREIHQKIDFQQNPLFLPEILPHYSQVRFQAYEKSPRQGASLEPLAKVQGLWRGDKFIVFFRKDSETKTYTRYAIARALSPYFLPPPSTKPVTTPNQQELAQLLAHLAEVRSNCFARNLLVPASMLKQEIKQASQHSELSDQLARSFWVSRSLINRRLRDLILEGQTG